MPTSAARWMQHYSACVISTNLLVGYDVYVLPLIFGFMDHSLTPDRDRTLPALLLCTAEGRQALHCRRAAPHAAAWLLLPAFFFSLLPPRSGFPPSVPALPTTTTAAYRIPAVTISYILYCCLRRATLPAAVSITDVCLLEDILYHLGGRASCCLYVACHDHRAYRAA